MLMFGKTSLRKDEDVATMLANFCVISRNVADGRKKASEATDGLQLTLLCDGGAQFMFQEDREKVDDLMLNTGAVAALCGQQRSNKHCGPKR